MTQMGGSEGKQGASCSAVVPFLSMLLFMKDPISTAASTAVSGMKDVEYGWPSLLPHLLPMGKLSLSVVWEASLKTQNPV